MFTGLVTDIGEIVSAQKTRFEIDCSYDAGSVATGASIACDGCCLTVVETKPRNAAGGCIFAVDVSNETLSRTTLGDWGERRRVNLERSLTPASELGGHIVTGHVDTVARVKKAEPDGASMRFEIEVDDSLSRFIAPKGSVALNGVSLTVNDVNGNRFGVNLIPHTLAVTTWSDISAGDAINLEVDLLARYVARIAEVSA